MERNGFIEHIQKGYVCGAGSIELGAAIFQNTPLTEARICIPLKTLNRHGLIAGATGTGKTVTLQLLAGQMSANGIPVLLMDVKGDLSGIAKAGTAGAKIREREVATGIRFEPAQLPTELLTISQEPGARLRATVSEFGPVLFSRILSLNETQSGVIAVLFKYADDNRMPLLDLKDVRKLLNHITSEAKEEIKKEYGHVSAATGSTIIRKLTELETQGAALFFGEPSFEIEDLLYRDAKHKGQVSVIRLADIQGKPALFSTFMLCLLAEIYNTMPEAGDLDKPKLCLFIDEAHLLFKEAGKALLEQIESIIRLIRSKGVGVFFVTQHPDDIPESVLSQLGLKVQHALRAFTEKDRKAIRKAAENYPASPYYKTDELLTTLGIGEALVTALNDKGVPTPLAAVHLAAPSTHIGTLSEEELNALVNSGRLSKKYNINIDRTSAYEILSEKIAGQQTETKEKEKRKPREKTMLEKASESTVLKQVGRTVARELTRGLLGVLGIGGRRGKKSWF
jgi:uncharacterized protein